MNRIIDALREGAKSKLIIGTLDTGILPAQSSVMFPVDIQANKLLLKSIEVTGSTNTEFRVEFFEEEAMLHSRYNSGVIVQENYDVLDLPYMNKDEVNLMYVVIHNTSDSDTEYRIEVRGIAMK